MNLFIVTSALYANDSIFNIVERLEQTKKTITSIRERSPNSHILFLDMSVKPLEDKVVSYIKNIVDYIELSDQTKIYNMTSTNVKRKSCGEVNGLYNVFDKKYDLLCKYDKIFKLSGRYYLNKNFNEDNFSGDKISFLHTSDKPDEYMTRLYCIPNKKLSTFKSVLFDCIKDIILNENEFYYVEKSMYKNYNDVNIMNVVGVSGNLSQSGGMIVE